MRLSEIYSLINDIDLTKYQIGYESSTKLSNLNNVKNLIGYLEANNFDFYKEEIEILKASDIYSTTRDSIDIYGTNHSDVYNNAIYLFNSINALKLVLSKIIPTSTETDFLIKFPKPDDFQMLLKDMGEIQKHISMIVNDESVNSSMEIHNWEYGSYWINLTLGSIVVVQLMGAITWSSAYISTQINKQKEQELYLRQINAQTEMIENIRDTHKVYLEQLIDNEIKHINEEHFDEEDNQRDKKIKNTIKLFSEIIQRGGEFQPSLISPKEIKDSYPDFKALDYIESKVKQITQTPESKKEETE